MIHEKLLNEKKIGELCCLFQAEILKPKQSVLILVVIIHKKQPRLPINLPHSDPLKITTFRAHHMCDKGELTVRHIGSHDLDGIPIDIMPDIEVL